MLKVSILGASGYSGSELLRILLQHQNVSVMSVTSERFAGLPVSRVFLNFRNTDLTFEPMRLDILKKKADLFFLCLPHKTAQDTVAVLVNAGKRVIDFSADFRLKRADTYQRWYDTPHKHHPLLKRAVYGLPEIHREAIRKASIVANPGCYPTGALLALAPIMTEGLIDTSSIIIDAKSGVSGAGRTPAQPFMFSEVNESIKAYAVTTHRHTPEIEQELSHLAGERLHVIFTPHLVPMDRGILSTVYVRLKRKTPLRNIMKRYRSFYQHEPFVRICDKGVFPHTKAVRGGNFCDISLFLDKRDADQQTLIIVSAIDNLLKGASGQAVHNMNIMFDFDETAGLGAAPHAP